jgi:hypothetical protein
MKDIVRLSPTLSLMACLLVNLCVSFTALAGNQPQSTALAAPAAVTWLQHDIRLNNIGVGVESAQHILFVSLGDGFDKPADYEVAFSYKQASVGYKFSIDGMTVVNGNRFRFKGIKYGVQIPLKRYLNGVLQDTYTLLFTNLPVLQLNAAKIVDEPKLPGSFRLLSGRFQQDTGILGMGIEFRGSGTQKYAKKSFGVQLAKPADWTKALDVKLLDLNVDSDWILDSVYVDTTFFRNLVSHDIFRAIRPGVYVDVKGVAHGQAALKGHLVEVIRNGGYEGVYSLNEKPGRKLYDLKKINVPVDAKGVPQWGKVDFNKSENGSVLYKASLFDAVFFESATVKRNFEQTYPHPVEAIRWAPLVGFANFVATANDKVFAADIAKWVDMDSVVDWWALVLASHAEDNIRHNFNIARSGTGKFFMLTWDNDGSFGVKWFGFEPDSNNLIRRLTKLPASGFNTKFKARWKQLRATELSQAKMVGRFKTYIDASNKGGARARNIARWPEANVDIYMGTAGYVNSFLADWLPKADKIVQGLPEAVGTAKAKVLIDISKTARP